MTYLVLEGIHGAGKSTVLRRIETRADTTTLPRFLVPVEQLLSTDLPPSLAFSINDVAKSVAAGLATTTHVVQDRSYAFTLASAIKRSKQGLEDIDDYRRWLETTIDSGKITRPDLVVILSAPAAWARERARRRHSDLHVEVNSDRYLTNATFLCEFYDNMPNWYVDMIGEKVEIIDARDESGVFVSVGSLLGNERKED